MNGNQIPPDKLKDLISLASEKLGTSEDKLTKAAQNGSFDKMLGNLKPQDAAKLQKVLSDKQSAEKLLSTPQARQLLKKLLEDKK